MNSNGGNSSGSGSSIYLSAPKVVILVAIEQYSRHYDWGPDALSDIAGFLVRYMYEPTWDFDIARIRDELAAIAILSEDQSLLELLLYRMNELRSLNSFFNFFDDIKQLVVEAESHMEADNEAILLDSESIFGIFVRRCCLAFEQLEFHQTSALHLEYACMLDGLQRSPGRDAGENANSSTAGACDPIACSQCELQEYAEFQIHLLEEGSSTPLPEAMEGKIRQLLLLVPDNARVHYLSYLNNIRTGDCEQSEASLRRFFDKNTVQDHRAVYQYALLYLAALRTQLGMVDEARLALAEATDIARDYHDHTCLLYIMSWETELAAMQLKRGKTPAAKIRQAINALIDKAAQMRNYELQAVGYLRLTESLIGTGTDPQGVFNSLVYSAALIHEYDVSRLCTPWYLTAARTWAAYNNPWISLLYLTMARNTSAGSKVLTEKENIELLRQQSHITSRLCSPGAAAKRLESETGSKSSFVNPGSESQVLSIKEWLELSSRAECTVPPSLVSLASLASMASSVADNAANVTSAIELEEIYDLIDRGYTADASALLDRMYGRKQQLVSPAEELL